MGQLGKKCRKTYGKRGKPTSKTSTEKKRTGKPVPNLLESTIKGFNLTWNQEICEKESSGGKLPGYGWPLAHPKRSN